jgi:hypothetical protein
MLMNKSRETGKSCIYHVRVCTSMGVEERWLVYRMCVCVCVCCGAPLLRVEVRNTRMYICTYVHICSRSSMISEYANIPSLG